MSCCDIHKNNPDLRISYLVAQVRFDRQTIIKVFAGPNGPVRSTMIYLSDRCNSQWSLVVMLSISLSISPRGIPSLNVYYINPPRLITHTSLYSSNNRSFRKLVFVGVQNIVEIHLKFTPTKMCFTLNILQFYKVNNFVNNHFFYDCQKYIAMIYFVIFPSNLNL